ncbi:TonB-dependent receptor [Novosphingobium sp. KACC 22771]|uniref:TonB-dependent receptor n=1 Tax=Novosphingobium sp. KACC 22771 TaxID=3025670 RepID=UPI0023669557|nr:TonB-dependent receptor [Novosphingobium sp. KACC 22771]WDF72906.1 TonB-dependent receptor [Novosphingobium sp. KACC 22771]
MKFTHILGASVLALAIAGPAMAQETKVTPDGDIVVTATRFETLASKTPIALTAVSGDALRTAGITNPTNLGDQVPSVMINRNNGLQITIRGVTSADGTEKGDPSAAFMMDGIYIARQQAQETSFYDISRVEVLRGPQGTLYGRNTTAGAVNLITNRPTFDKLKGDVNIAYGNYNNTQAGGAINVPVTDNLAIRAAVNYDHRDSFLKAGANLSGLNLSPFKDVFSGRLQALLKFDHGELLVRGDYNQMKGISSNALPTSNFYSNYATSTVMPTYIAKGVSNSQLLTLNAPSADGLPMAYLANNLKRDNATYGLDVDFKYDFGAVTLNYLGSYREFKRHEGNYSYYGTGNPNTAGLAPNKFDGWYWQNSQELRLSTNGTGPFRAQAGVYYFKERADIQLAIYDRMINGSRLQPGQIVYTGTTPNGYVYGFPQHYVMSSSVAGFGQVTYSPTEKLHITAGARYTKDEKARTGATINCAYTIACTTPGDIQTPNVAKRSYEKATWKVGVDYNLNAATMLFGTISTGYKAGGFNDGCEAGTAAGCTLPASTLYYQPETLTAYEIGAKARLFDNKLRLNFSAFHYNYNNLQLTQVGPFCQGGQQCTQTTNAASAKVDGIEAEGTYAIVKNGKLDVQLSLLDARYGTFFPNAAAYPTLNLANTRLDRSPTTTLTVGYTHTFPMANGGEIIAGVRSKYSSSYNMLALSINSRFVQPSYTQTEVNVTYNSPDKTYYVQAYGKNLENNLLVTAAGAGINGTLQVSDPLMYGVRAGFKF